jgi:dTMP kinase
VGLLIRQLLGQLSEPPDPAALALLFAADRLDHLRREIEPALEDGRMVISDRYVLSSLAYQSLQNPLPWVEEINRFAPPPDLTVLLHVEAEVAAARRASRGGHEEIFDALPTQRLLVSRYAELAARRTEQRVVVLDGSPDIETVAAALERIALDALESRDAG